MAGLATRDSDGLTPPAITGYTNLSVGGTLSVGGVGAQTTNTAGMQMERVQELEVATGRGDVKRCSPTRDRELFESVLGGLGQFGIITPATVDLVSAEQGARSTNPQVGRNPGGTEAGPKRY